MPATAAVSTMMLPTFFCFRLKPFPGLQAVDHYASLLKLLLMKIFTPLAIACLLSTQAIAQSSTTETSAPGTWTHKADFGGVARTKAAAFTIGDKIYIGTGITINYQTLNDFWEYDPNTDVWTRKADFPGATRYEAVGFSIKGKGYICLGGNYGSSYYTDIWEYDPLKNSWTKKADFPGQGRIQLTGFSIGDKGYIGGGWTFPNNYYNDFWEFNPSINVWTRKADLIAGGGRSDPASFAIGNKGYFGTGEFQGQFSKKFAEYDPTSDKWTRKADFEGEGRFAAAGFSIGSKGYFCFGEFVSGSLSKDIWEYDAAADKWSRQTDLPGEARAHAIGVVLNDKGYIGTGDATIPYLHRLKDFWEFDPAGITCNPPSDLVIDEVSSTTVKLGFTKPGSSIVGYLLRYRPVGTYELKERLVKPASTHVKLNNLHPNTTYIWKMSTVCEDATSTWVKGPVFTTTASVAFNAEDAISSGAITGEETLQVIPNPNKGNFSLKVQLPQKAANTTLTIYNNFGAKVWQQELGNISGALNRNIAVTNKLTPGAYVITIQRNDIKLTQKMVVTQ